jgi:hypothetical protein
MRVRTPIQTQTFTVICRWHPPGDACKPWQFIAVIITRCTDAQEAANNACLYLIWELQGMAEPWLVVEGQPRLSIPDGGRLDAEDFDEIITFSGKIVSKSELS